MFWMHLSSSCVVFWQLWWILTCLILICEFKLRFETLSYFVLKASHVVSWQLWWILKCLILICEFKLRFEILSYFVLPLSKLHVQFRHVVVWFDSSQTVLTRGHFWKFAPVHQGDKAHAVCGIILTTATSGGKWLCSVVPKSILDHVHGHITQIFQSGPGIWASLPCLST